MLNRNESSSASSHLEFSTDWSNTRGSVWTFLTGAKTEMSFSFSISGTSKQQDVFSSGGKLCELVESQAASLSSSDSISSGLSESESNDSESFGYFE